MKKRGLAAALAMLTMATTGTAFAATNFDVWLYRVDEGYNASVATKSIATDHAYINDGIPLEAYFRGIFLGGVFSEGK